MNEIDDLRKRVEGLEWRLGGGVTREAWNRECRERSGLHLGNIELREECAALTSRAERAERVVGVARHRMSAPPMTWRSWAAEVDERGLCDLAQICREIAAALEEYAKGEPC